MCHCISAPPMSGTSVKRHGFRQEVHRADQLLRPVGLGLVHEALRLVGIERDVVVDQVPLDEVLEAGRPVADALVPGGFGDLVVGPLRQPHDVEGNEVLGSGLLLGRHAGDAAEVDRLRRVVRLRGDGRCCVWSCACVAHVDPLLLGHGGLAGTDAFQCCEHAARMRCDPHVHHRVLAAGVDAHRRSCRWRR